MSRALMRRRVRTAPVVYDPYAPRYTLPTQVQYNAGTRRCELTSATVTRLAYATDTAGTTPVTLANSGSTATNADALATAIANVIAANGTANVHNLRRIRLTPGAGEWGTGYEWNTALVDNNGVGCFLVIESTAVGTTLRAEGERVGLDDAALMPVFGLTTYNLPAFRFFGAARRIRFVGIYFGISAASVVALRAGQYGRASTPPGNDAPFTFNGHLCYEHHLPPFNSSDVAIAGRQSGTPADIRVDRCVLVGDDDVRIRRLMLANFDRFACTDSYLECAGDYAGAPDSQAITTISTNGDHIVRNCGIYQAHGEHVIYGGGPVYGAQFANADVVWMDNDLGFLTRWGPGAANFVHKNHWECKVAERVLIEGNRIRDYYGYGRFGNQFRAIVFKASDQLTGEAFVQARNITCRLNLFERVSGVFQIVGGDRFAGAGDFKALHRLEFAFNANLPWDQAAVGLGFSAASIVQYSAGTPPATAGTVDDPEKYLVTDLAIRYNTLWGADAPGENFTPTLTFAMEYSATPELRRLTLSNNALAGVNPYPGWPITLVNNTNTVGLPTDWTRTVRTDVVSRNNAMSGVTNQATQLDASLGSSNLGYSTLAGLGLNTTTLQPNGGSPLIGASEDGLNIGADWTLLTAATTRSLTGRS